MKNIQANSTGRLSLVKEGHIPFENSKIMGIQWPVFLLVAVGVGVLVSGAVWILEKILQRLKRRREAAQNTPEMTEEQHQQMTESQGLSNSPVGTIQPSSPDKTRPWTPTSPHFVPTPFLGQGVMYHY